MRRLHFAIDVLAIAVMLALLGACAGTPERPADYFRVGAIPSQCDATCTTPCTPATAADWPQWTGDPEDPRTWDTWPEQVGAPLREMAERCELARQSCVKCLGRLDKTGVTCGVATRCAEAPAP